MLFASALVHCTGALQANELVVNEDNDRDLLHAKLLHDRGIDPYRISIDRAREMGI